MVYVDSKLCDGCGLCVEACPNDAIEIAGGVAVIDPTSCRETGACLGVCPPGALLQITEPVEPVAKDSHRLPVPVRVTPLVKKAPASITRPPVGVGAWLGAALAYVVSDVAPQIFRHWLERRRQPSSPALMATRPMGRGRCDGTGKLHRRRRKGRRI
jgi:NAD-dependent dihydropyrimidine dehydrogenase PreA subunit